MRYTGEMRLQTFGDQVRAHEFIPFAREMAFNLQRQMGFGDLKVLGDYKIVDGVEVTVRIRHNLVEAVINAPPTPQPEVPLIEFPILPTEIYVALIACALPQESGRYLSESANLNLSGMTDITADFAGGTWFYGSLDGYDGPFDIGFTVPYASAYGQLNLTQASIRTGGRVDLSTPSSGYAPRLHIYESEICFEGSYTSAGGGTSAAVPGTDANVYQYSGTLLINDTFERKVTIFTWDGMGLFHLHIDPDTLEETAYCNLDYRIYMQLIVAENKVTNKKTGEVKDCDTIIGYYYKDVGFDGDESKYYDPNYAGDIAVINITSPQLAVLAKHSYSGVAGIKDRVSNKSYLLHIDETGNLITDKLPADWEVV